MHPSTRVLLLLPLLLPRAPAGHAQEEATPLDGLPCSRFEWIAHEGVSERAALRVPVTLDGTGYWFQLDTGSDATMLYGEEPRRRGWERLDNGYRAPAVRLGGTDLGPAWIYGRDEREPDEGTQGTLGLDLLVGHVVVLDFPGERFCLVPRGRVPAALWTRTAWTPARLRDGKLFLEAELDGKPLEGVFFDTGASAFSFSVDLPLWRELTGLASGEEATERLVVPSWGSEVTLLGAPARGDLRVGSVRIERPLVFHMRERPDLFAEWPFPATGLVGNAPFWDRVVVLDLGLEPRFGLLGGERPPPAEADGPGRGLVRSRVEVLDQRAKPAGTPSVAPGARGRHLPTAIPPPTDPQR